MTTITTATAFPTAVAFLLRAEGGAADDPQDPGGWTAAGGLTQALLDTMRQADGRPSRPIREATPEDLEEAHRYVWDQSGAPAVVTTHPLTAVILMDTAWNQGLGYARRLLQWGVGSDQDGAIGPRTLLALDAVADSVLADTLLWGRLLRYHGTVQARKRQGLDPWRFYRGWFDRLGDLWALVPARRHLLGTPP